MPLMSSIWVSLLIRSAVILLGAEILRRFPRKLSPAYRHRIVLAAFVMLLVWPLSFALLPQIRIPLWPHLPTHASVSVEQRFVSFGGPAASPPRINWPLVLWIAGVFLSCVPVAVGYFNVVRIARAAVPLRDPAWQQLLEKLSRDLNLSQKPELLVAPGPVTPLAFGLRRLRILLPRACFEWSDLRRRSVLLHELAHVQRRDVMAQLFVNAMTALWWFQPLCWISRWSLRRESERACDGWVLASGVRPSDYATELLDIAQNFHARPCWSSAGIRMARRGELEDRLKTILAPQFAVPGHKPLIAAISVLILLTLTASAVTVGPRQETFLGGPLHMKRTILAGLMASAGLSAATISGSLFETNGAAVSDAKASLLNPDTDATQETTTTYNGKFSFENLPAGQYILHIEKPGFASVYREFNVQADSNVERGLFLTLPATSSAAQPIPGHPGQLRVGGEVAESNLINKVQPIYPPSAKEAGIHGTVSMDVAISKEGVPEEISVLSSPSDDLTQSALEAVRQWRYRPTLLNGQPVDILTNVIVNYTLLK